MKYQGQSTQELIEYIESLQSKLDESESKVSVLSTQLLKAEEQVRIYKEKLAAYKNQTFGSKSEKIEPGQVSLFNEVEKESNPTLEEPKLKEKTNEESNQKKDKNTRKEKRKREVVFTGLPVERIEHPVEISSCPHCHEELHEIRKEITRELKIIPAKVVVVEHERTVVGCRNCDKNEIHTPIITAAMPNRAIPKSIVSSSFLSYIIVQKYMNGTLLYRIEQEFKRLGIDLSRQNLANWMIKSAEWFEHLFNRMHQILLKQDILQADETTLQVLREPGRAPTTKSYMWLYRTGRYGPGICLYDYQPTRAGENAKNFLEGFKGYLQVDGYQGYDKVPATIVACWAHARRYFFQAIKAQPQEPKNKKKESLTIAEQGFLFCEQLYDIEHSIKDKSPEDRYKIRLERSRPILDAFSVWLNEKSLVVLPKSKTGQAIIYCLNQWEKLNNYLLDGRLDIDNNRSE